MTMKKTKKNYTAPHIDIIDQAPGNIMGAQFSIIEDDTVVEDGESWDNNEYVGSWENIWGSEG